MKKIEKRMRKKRKKRRRGQREGDKDHRCDTTKWLCAFCEPNDHDSPQSRCERYERRWERKEQIQTAKSVAFESLPILSFVPLQTPPNSLFRTMLKPLLSPSLLLVIPRAVFPNTIQTKRSHIDPNATLRREFDPLFCFLVQHSLCLFPSHLKKKGRREEEKRRSRRSRRSRRRREEEKKKRRREEEKKRRREEENHRFGFVDKEKVVKEDTENVSFRSFLFGFFDSSNHQPNDQLQDIKSRRHQEMERDRKREREETIGKVVTFGHGRIQGRKHRADGGKRDVAIEDNGCNHIRL